MELVNLEYSYDEYKATQSKFWDDIPYTNLLKRRKNDRKRNKDYSFLLKKRPAQMERIADFKMSKKKKRRIEHTKGEDADKTFLSSTRRFIEHSKLKATLNITDVDLSCYTAQDDNATVPIEKIGPRKSENCKNVYVEYNKHHHTLDIQDCSPEMIIDNVSKLTLVPKDLMIVFHKGKILNRNLSLPDIEPYDCLKVIVKGKGGMQKGEIAKTDGTSETATPVKTIETKPDLSDPEKDMKALENKDKSSETANIETKPDLSENENNKASNNKESYTIQQSSTESDVKRWLIDVVGCTEETITDYDLDELNGELLWNYSIANIDDFRELLPNAPIGLLRKILLVKEHNEKTKLILKLEESKWSPEQVVMLVEETLKGKLGPIEDICKAVKDKCIGGLVFLSYQDYKELQKDLFDETKYNIQLQKVFSKGQDIVKRIKLNQPVKSDGMKNIKESPRQENSSEKSETSQNSGKNRSIQSQKETRNPQRHRPFLGPSQDIQYFARNILERCESGGTLSDRCFEYKLFVTSLNETIDKAVLKFLIETLRFACAVLNSRKNGTICFGIGDSNDKKFQHGEVVGFTVDREFKSVITDALHKAICSCFEDVCQSTALACIGDPVFINVVTPGSNDVKYVIEVDIEPTSARCSDVCFRIDRSKLENVGNIKKLEKDLTVFVRKGSSTEKFDMDVFVNKHLPRYVDDRKKFDDEKRKLNFEPIELPMTKLTRLLCNGLDKFDSSFCPIIILGKPTEQQKGNAEWRKQMQFLNSIEFYCVFDFDDRSFEDGGLCFTYKKNYQIGNNKQFEDSSSRFQKLKSELGFPHDPKRLWIFSNGRSDANRPHLDITSWSEEYVEIRDAVIFYSNVLPKHRTIVVVMLFSDDFAGVIDTLHECVTRFGWDRVVVIAAEESVFKTFKLTMERFQKGKEEDIRRRSIHGQGITWEQIGVTISKLSGQEEVHVDYIPKYGGGSVPVERIFLDDITDLEILSSTMCTTTREDDNEKFRISIEKQFYKGGRVSWYNFLYDNVCERHVFKNLKAYIENILTSEAHEHQGYAYPIFLKYQPGAGATTIARHLLWTFHKHFRCAIVRKLTERTVNNILALWQYKEPGKRRPIFLVVDDLSEHEFYPHELAKKIQNHFNYANKEKHIEVQGPICCIFICHQDLDEKHVLKPDVNEKRFHKQKSYLDHTEYHLMHKLTDDEIRWFDDKFKQMEKRREIYKPDTLIAFLLLRKDFDESFIREKVKELLKCFDSCPEELDLLSFVALITSFGNQSCWTKKAFIPIECCDKLIGEEFSKGKAWDFWERSFNDEKRIFLIIDKNTTYHSDRPFKEIRMYNPKLARVILDIFEEKGQGLSDITCKFLDSPIMKINPSRPADCIIESKTKEMLKKRLKEEYNDKETTSFSPLIEAIVKREDLSKAVSVLKTAAMMFDDCYIYQTLSRLLAKNKQFDDAITWAEKAKDFALTKEEEGFCYQSLGVVLNKKFEHFQKNEEYLDYNSAGDYIQQLVLTSYNLFSHARELVAETGEMSELYLTHDILRSIILCGEHIIKRVKFPKGLESQRLRVLLDSTYNIDELPVIWKDIRAITSSFTTEGQKSFQFIQQKLCFEPIYYSHDPKKLHRFHRILQGVYPNLLNDYIQIFGEDNDNPVDESNPMVRDECYRRKVLKYMGNNYMDLYNRIYKQVKKKTMTIDKAVEDCLEIKGHLELIEKKEDPDSINLVAVNILLSTFKRHLRRKTMTPIKDLIEYCEVISREDGKCTDQAHFFLSMLLWPIDENERNYNDDLFYRTLKHFTRRRPRFRTKRDSKGENNITKPSSQFFLSDGRDLDKMCHRFDVYLMHNDESYNKDNFWNREKVKRKVKRLQGTIQSGKTGSYISVPNPMSRKRDIQIQCRKFNSDVRVSFVLGFSINGLIAVDVQEVKSGYNPSYCTEEEDFDEDYSAMTEDQLSSLLSRISDLRNECRKFTKSEERLLDNEEAIQDALNIKNGEWSWNGLW